MTILFQGSSSSVCRSAPLEACYLGFIKPQMNLRIDHNIFINFSHLMPTVKTQTCSGLFYSSYINIEKLAQVKKADYTFEEEDVMHTEW
jgi:hypothetical protein